MAVAAYWGVTFGQYVEWVETARRSNHAYLVANNDGLAGPLRALVKDIGLSMESQLFQLTAETIMVDQHEKVGDLLMRLADFAEQ